MEKVKCQMYIYRAYLQKSLISESSTIRHSMHKTEMSSVDVLNSHMRDLVTWDSLVDRSSRLGRRHWRRDCRTSHVGLVEWRGHWWCLTEDSDDVITTRWAYTCRTDTEEPCCADSGRLWQQLWTWSVRPWRCRRSDRGRSLVVLDSIVGNTMDVL